MWESPFIIGRSRKLSEFVLSSQLRDEEPLHECKGDSGSPSREQEDDEDSLYEVENGVVPTCREQEDDEISLYEVEDGVVPTCREQEDDEVSLCEVEDDNSSTSEDSELELRGSRQMCRPKEEFVYRDGHVPSSNAYVVLVMKDPIYAYGAIVTAASFQKRVRECRGARDVDLVCMLTPELYKDRSIVRALLSPGRFDKVFKVDYIDVKTIRLGSVRKENMYSSWKTSACTKWRMLDLYRRGGYEKVCMIDADAMFNKDPTDKLFGNEGVTKVSPLAATFSNPWASVHNNREQQKVIGLLSNELVPESWIRRCTAPLALAHNRFPIETNNVLIGTTVVVDLKTIGCHASSIALESYLARQVNSYGVFGLNSGSMIDEQALCGYFASEHLTKWAMVGPEFNMIPRKLQDWKKLYNTLNSPESLNEDLRDAFGNVNDAYILHYMGSNFWDFGNASFFRYPDTIHAKEFLDESAKAEISRVREQFVTGQRASADFGTSVPTLHLKSCTAEQTSLAKPQFDYNSNVSDQFFRPPDPSTFEVKDLYDGIATASLNMAQKHSSPGTISTVPFVSQFVSWRYVERFIETNSAVKRAFINSLCKTAHRFAGKNRTLTGIRVLELASGRGGDMHAWAQGGVHYLLGCDISDKSVQEARSRIQAFSGTPSIEMYNPNRYQYVEGDMTKRMEWVQRHHKDGRTLRGYFDIVACNFAAHYAHESLGAKEAFESNIVAALDPETTRDKIYMQTVVHRKFIMTMRKQRHHLERGDLSVMEYVLREESLQERFGAKHASSRIMRWSRVCRIMGGDETVVSTALNEIINRFSVLLVDGSVVFDNGIIRIVVYKPPDKQEDPLTYMFHVPGSINSIEQTLPRADTIASDLRRRSGGRKVDTKSVTFLEAIGYLPWNSVKTSLPNFKQLGVGGITNSSNASSKFQAIARKLSHKDTDREYLNTLESHMPLPLRVLETLLVYEYQNYMFE